MSTLDFTNQRRVSWGLFLTVMFAVICGMIVGNALIDQRSSFATEGAGQERFGTYSPVEEVSDGAFRQVMETEIAAPTGTRVVLHNSNGQTKVSSWEKATVWVHAKKQVHFQSGWLGFLGLGGGGNLSEAKKELDQTEVVIEQGDGELRILTKVPKWRSEVSSSIDYEILIPKHLALEVESSNGSVEIENLESEVQAKSSNGKLEIRDVAGPVTVSTTNGKFQGERIGGPLKAESTNGKIEAQQVGGGSELKSSNGKIEIELLNAPLDSEKVICETSNGGVEIRLPRGSGFHVDLKSNNGTVRTDFELAQSEVQESNRLEGHVGSGGGLVQARTSNGSIEVKMD
ncbi:MAG: DUF4097 family beta strand repeat protein [Candidatus Omnitrophica bacterium]|nr:DUF4097 family beta strand repeat protein [Candidatus Omnitrophota bacterium]